MIVSRTTMPAPIAIFFQAFIISVTSGVGFSRSARSRQIVYLMAKTSSASAGLTDTHLLLRFRPRESSRTRVVEEWPRPVTLGNERIAPGTQYYSPATLPCSQRNRFPQATPESIPRFLPRRMLVPFQLVHWARLSLAFIQLAALK